MGTSPTMSTSTTAATLLRRPGGSQRVAYSGLPTNLHYGIPDAHSPRLEQTDLKCWYKWLLTGIPHVLLSHLNLDLQRLLRISLT